MAAARRSVVSSVSGRLSGAPELPVPALPVLRAQEALAADVIQEAQQAIVVTGDVEDAIGLGDGVLQAPEVVR